MSSLFTSVEQSPEAASTAFARMDEALNAVLPGSNAHSRYRDVSEVGLAIVVGRRNVPLDRYNPFDYPFRTANFRRYLSFVGDNQEAHPETWTSLDSDVDVLGGVLPEGIGRLTAFALAKMNTLLDDDTQISSIGQNVSRGRGKVGLAGGIRLGHSLVATSGLWELHDHVVSRFFQREVISEIASSDPARNADTLAGELDDVFDKIRSMYDGDVASLDRWSLTKLLFFAGKVVSKVDGRRDLDDTVVVKR